jgi:vancomycin resistance protein YoaR
VDPAWVWVLAIGAPLLLLTVFALGERILLRGRILHGVEIAGASVSGESEDAAARALRRHTAPLATDPVRVRIDGEERAIDPRTIGLRVDVPSTIEDARRAGRSVNSIAVLGGAVLRRFRPDRIPLVVDVDEARLEAVLSTWRRETARGLVNGTVRVEGVDVVEVPPESGAALRVDEARAALLDAWRHGRTDTVTLPYGRDRPDVGRAAVARAAARARRVLARPAQVTVGNRTFVVTPGEIAATLTFTPRGRRLAVGVDAPSLHAVLAPGLAGIERPPVDATWTVDGATATVVPSVTGQVLDTVGVARQIAAARRRVVGRVTTIEPERDTAWAESLNITELVSTFTTRHNCCEDRVTNIHRAADAIDSTVVEPGAVFSLNGVLGPRTIEKGYVPAPAIGEDLELVDDVGGGVSQLSTTLFNATYFGGYEDVTHEVHSFYISRYPMGREATLNYPSIDNRFRNDSSSGVLIETSYTETSITVSFYGNKEGRIVESEGPNVLETIPPPVEYTDDLALEPGAEKVTREGSPGYVVENIRIIQRAGEPAVRQRFLARYRPVPTKASRNPTPPAPAAPVPAPPPAPVVPPVPPPA